MKTHYEYLTSGIPTRIVSPLNFIPKNQAKGLQLYRNFLEKSPVMAKYISLYPSVMADTANLEIGDQNILSTHQGTEEVALISCRKAVLSL